MIAKERMTVRMDTDFVVFLIGMRVNKPWKFWKWLPIFASMGKMLRELGENPDLGFLSTEFFFGRTLMLVQYWKSVDHLNAYALNQDAAHLPAWKEFNRRIGKSGDVGIYHETYPVSKGGYEVIYANMPPFGLSKVKSPETVSKPTETASKRMKANELPTSI